MIIRIMISFRGSVHSRCPLSSMISMSSFTRSRCLSCGLTLAALPSASANGTQRGKTSPLLPSRSNSRLQVARFAPLVKEGVAQSTALSPSQPCSLARAKSLRKLYRARACLILGKLKSFSLLSSQQPSLPLQTITSIRQRLKATMPLRFLPHSLPSSRHGVKRATIDGRLSRHLSRRPLVQLT